MISVRVGSAMENKTRTVLSVLLIEDDEQYIRLIRE